MSLVHYHCENGCEKAVFHADDMTCVKCGGKAENEPECWCVMTRHSGPHCEAEWPVLKT